MRFVDWREIIQAGILMLLIGVAAVAITVATLFALSWFGFLNAHAQNVNPSITQQCDNETNWYISGMELRNYGHKRAIKSITPNQYHGMIESGEIKQLEDGSFQLPKDYMWIPNYDNLPEDVRERIKIVVFFGWDQADKIINNYIAEKLDSDKEWEGKINAGIAPIYLIQEAQKFFQACLQKKAGERRVNFIKTQSEHLDDDVGIPEDVYSSMDIRLEGCRHNLPIYFHKCMTRAQPYSEAQIGKAIKACNRETWDKFFFSCLPEEVRPCAH